MQCIFLIFAMAHVRAGEITALIGSNGAGRTTLMHPLSGLNPVQSGQCLSEGEDLSTTNAATILPMAIQSEGDSDPENPKVPVDCPVKCC